MPQLTPEFEEMLRLIVFLDCKIEAVTDLLRERGISLSTEEIESKTHKIHAVQCDPKRYRILSMMKDGKFDFS
jgi:hypothetical protein